MKFVDCVRYTKTNLESDEEARIEDVWCTDGARALSGSWTGTTGFDLLRPQPPDGYTWVGARLTKIQKTTRPGSVWPEVWFAMNGRQRREAQ
eukprot:10405201-Karenia_brevis.AAC.1